MNKTSFLLCCLSVLVLALPAWAADTEPGPAISNIIPDTISRGGTITVTGSNLSQNNMKTVVKIDGKDVSFTEVEPGKKITIQVNTNPLPDQMNHNGEYNRTLVVSVNGQTSNEFVFHQLTWKVITSARVFSALIVYLGVVGIICLRSDFTVFKSKTGNWSLSKVQMAAWTFVFGLFYVILSAGYKEFLDITEGMFWLMGVSSATAAGAKAIVVKNDMKIPDNPSKLLKDWNDHKNQYELSLHRAQIFVWTLIVLTIFVIKAFETMQLPAIPNNLLILMGISGGTYLGFNYPKVKTTK